MKVHLWELVIRKSGEEREPTYPGQTNTFAAAGSCKVWGSARTRNPTKCKLTFFGPDTPLLTNTPPKPSSLPSCTRSATPRSPRRALPPSQGPPPPPRASIPKSWIRSSVLSRKREGGEQRADSGKQRGSSSRGLELPQSPPISSSCCASRRRYLAPEQAFKSILSRREAGQRAPMRWQRAGAGRAL